MAGHLFRGELLHLYSLLTDDYPLVDKPSVVRTALEIGVSLVRHPRFDDFTIDDLGLFI